MRFRKLFVALGCVAAIAVTPSAVASATERPARDRDVRVFSDPTTSAVSYVAIYTYNTGNYDVARCWNHFAPGAPIGLPMAQVYRNCNSGSLRVRAGYVTASGFVATTACYLVYRGETFVVLYNSTVTAGSYRTVAC